MTTLHFALFRAPNFKVDQCSILAEMLREQGKVKRPSENKTDRCHLLCIATIDDHPVAIGAVKQKTRADFSAEKADLPELASEFEWELGYLYTRRAYEGRGICSTIVRVLLDAYGDGPIMASTEISANPGMVKILERHGFRLFGKPWKSNMHDNFLGLFLRLR